MINRGDLGCSDGTVKYRHTSHCIPEDLDKLFASWSVSLTSAKSCEAVVFRVLSNRSGGRPVHARRQRHTSADISIHAAKDYSCHRKICLHLGRACRVREAKYLPNAFATLRRTERTRCC